MLRKGQHCVTEHLFNVSVLITTNSCIWKVIHQVLLFGKNIWEDNCPNASAEICRSEERSEAAFAFQAWHFFVWV